MLIFVGWSGAVSEAVAAALAEWLPSVIQAVRPWLSKDIHKGQRWPDEVAQKLEEARFGIICLTADNLESPWILFEAGAISKTRDFRTRVCTYLFNVHPGDLSWPLAMFQAAEATKDSTFEMLKSINAALENGSLAEDRLRSTFNLLWPQLEERLAGITAMPQPARRRGQTKCWPRFWCWSVGSLRQAKGRSGDQDVEVHSCCEMASGRV